MKHFFSQKGSPASQTGQMGRKLTIVAMSVFVVFLTTVNSALAKKGITMDFKDEMYSLKTAILNSESLYGTIEAQTGINLYGVNFYNLDGAAQSRVDQVVYSHIDKYRALVAEGETSNYAFHLPMRSTPWASSYFNRIFGGIAGRWQETVGFSTYHRLNQKAHVAFLSLDPDDLLSDSEVLEKLRSMSREDLDKLSPIEKFDIIRGKYQFPGTTFEMVERGAYSETGIVTKIANSLLKRNRVIPSWITHIRAPWQGFCNGKASASIALPEPVSDIEVSNADGINVTLKIADLKALASAAYFFNEKYVSLGRPTKTHHLVTHEFSPNMAVFDFALRSYLMGLNKSFIIDNHANAAINNVALNGYERTIKSIKPLSKFSRKEREEILTQNPQTAKVAEVLTKLFFVNHLTTSKESDQRTVEDIVYKGKYIKDMKIRYLLFLDGEGNIIDGKLTDGDLDFAWFPAGKGADATHEELDKETGRMEKQGNEELDFDMISNLVYRSAGRIYN
ncbi:MAG: hypothetical protein HQK53_05390 [Oligoflexia bacterium]|nr:hypothetical protein [Oligoflexia bacterium]